MRTQFDTKISGQACFIDLKESFDFNNQNNLLHKFYACGIRGPNYDLIDDYLKDRMQYVFWGQKRSTLSKMTSGISQGSVLGFFLFLIYINDLPEHAQKIQSNCIVC